MEAMFEAIKLAVADDATSETKKAGAEACRTILTALEGEPGVALVVPGVPPPSPLAGLELTQVLDLAIARLRSVVGEDSAEVEREKGYQVQLVPVPGRK